MPHPKNLSLLLSASILGMVAGPVLAQPQGKVGLYSDVTVPGSILEPEKIEVEDDAALARLISAPQGFKAEIYARDLVNPRMLAVSEAGKLYATRRSVGDVVMLEDSDGDGKAEAKTVASRPGMHGIAFDGNQVFLATVNDVYVADVAADGSFGPLKRIINDLPDGGQHPNRTIAIGPDGMLYISVGSTCNACAETNPESATLLRASRTARAGRSSRKAFATRSASTGSRDRRRSTASTMASTGWATRRSSRSSTRSSKGQNFGWPYIYGKDEFNPQANPPAGHDSEQWAAMAEQPGLGLHGPCRADADGFL